MRVFLAIMILLPCMTDSAERPEVSREIISREVIDMRSSGWMEELWDWAISCVPRFVKEKGGKPLVEARHHAVAIVSKASMDDLYLRVNGRVPPKEMTAFRWAKNEIVIMSNGERGELYHEAGHYLFGDDERMSEEFRKWCLAHDHESPVVKGPRAR